MADCVNALKEWTGKANATILYDSTVDEFTDNGLFNKVKGKLNIAIVVFTSDGDVFGGFFSVAVTAQNTKFHDPNMFIFSFESHGRCITPQKFDVKDHVKGEKYVMFSKNNPHGIFACIGAFPGCFYPGNEKSTTYCNSLSLGYDGIEDDTLTGKPDLGTFTCSRIVTILLE